MKQFSNNFLSELFVHDMDDTLDTKYYGYLAIDGRWIIRKIVTATGVVRFAGGCTDTSGSSSGYTTAWTDRAALSYGYITGVTT